MSENSVIQMYGTADTDASATIDVPDDGVLLAVEMNINGTGASADGEYILAQISFSSVSQFITNDARGVVSHCGISFDVAGTAANIFNTSAHTSTNLGDGIKVFGGERLYLHVASSGVGLSRAHCLLLFNFKNFVQRRR